MNERGGLSAARLLHTNKASEGRFVLICGARQRIVETDEIEAQRAQA
jgi:hypothetical protein